MKIAQIKYISADKNNKKVNGYLVNIDKLGNEEENHIDKGAQKRYDVCV